MAEEFFSINGPKGFLAAVLHRADPKRVVVMAHGFTGLKSESERLFVLTARALAEGGISALRFDFWGSGDSEGNFSQMSPNTEIADLHAVIGWAKENGFSEIGVLGLSMGGAVSICTVSQNPLVKTLVTWSAVPELAWWTQSVEIPKNAGGENPMAVGPQLQTDLPKIDVPEAYVTLKIPKLQIQGDNDIPGFLERFRDYFPAAPEPKEHIVLPGGGHVFSEWSHRKEAIRLTVAWFQKYL